jgi:hypothetical protein
VRQTTSTITLANRWDHVLARCAYNRMGHVVPAGLYALGQPNEDSPVLVTANYSLSFDALREAMAGGEAAVSPQAMAMVSPQATAGRDAYLLVLETKGINVWCAAGKGTFGTDELSARVCSVDLANRVRHRTLILPQLGASGVSAHEVQKRTGFRVEYGPVRAEDLPRYLDQKSASPDMRQVRFNLLDRLVLIPVEVVGGILPMAVAALLLYLVGGPRSALAAVAAVLAGVVLFPILLPWLPTRGFSTKGFVLGGLVALPFAGIAAARPSDGRSLVRLASLLTYLLLMPAATAFLALNFTGSTPVASRTGVRREIFRYVPVMAGMAVLGLILAVGAAVFGRVSQ